MDSTSRRNPLPALLLALACASALALAAPAAASAAFAPQISATLSPATPDSPTQLTTLITQKADEDANKDVRVTIPSGFGLVLSSLTDFCTPDQITAKACPEGSRIGSARAVAAAPPTTFTGGVYYGGSENGATKLIIFLSNGVSLLDQTIVGRQEFRPDGGFDNVFQNLPNVLTTSFELKINGPPRPVFRTPERCGTYMFSGSFTSQKGATATSSTPVTIAGCPPPVPRAPRISAARVTPSPLRSRQRAVLSFRLDKAGAILVTVTRRGSGQRAHLIRRVGRKALNRVALGRLRAGRYRVGLRVTARGNVAKRTLSVRVLPPVRRR